MMTEEMVAKPVTRPVTYAQEVERLKAAKLDRSAESAEELLAFLLEWGTPLDVLRRLEAWYADHGAAKAQDLYDHMRNVDATDATRPEPPLTQGTIRRAALWTYGREPDEAEQMAPAEELSRLRAECDKLHEHLATAKAERMSLSNENVRLRDALNQATTQLAIVRAGQPEIPAPQRPPRRPTKPDLAEAKAE